MSTDESFEWLEAIHELHKHSTWFKDLSGMTFSFLWYDSVKGRV